MSLLSPHHDSPIDLPDAQEVLDSLDEAILVIDARERILLANRRWRESFGHNGSEWLGDHLHPADLEPWHRILARLNRGQLPEPTRLRLLSDDELYWYELRAQPLTAGSFWPISLSLCNITPEIRRQQRQDAGFRVLSQLVEHLPVMLYRARNNRHWSMEFVSAGCHQVTGYSAEALLNQPRLSYGELIHPEDAGPVWDSVQEALHRHRPFELHYRIRHANGSLCQVSEKGCGLYSATGQVLGVEGVILCLDKDRISSSN